MVYGDGGATWPAGCNAQVYDNFTDDKTPITDLASATAALELVVRQGEGTATDPGDGTPGELAHYYQLQTILGALGPDDLRPMVRNGAGVTWAPRCAALLDFFDAGYSHVLRLLEGSFNGRGTIGPPVGLMWAVINALAAYVVEVPYQAAGADEPGEQTLTPRYRYTTTTPAAGLRQGRHGRCAERGGAGGGEGARARRLSAGGRPSDADHQAPGSLRRPARSQADCFPRVRGLAW